MDDLAFDRTRDGLDRSRDAGDLFAAACVALAAFGGNRSPGPASTAP